MLKQIFAITALNLRGIPQRPLASLVIVVGIAAVVGVLISVLAINAGLTRSVDKVVKPNMVIVMSSGTTADYMGSLPKDVGDIVAQAPGIKKFPDGRPIVQPVASIIVSVDRKTDGSPVNTMFRGINGRDFGKVGTAHLVKGRMFRPGLRELIAGQAASRQFKNLDVGDHVSLRGSDWTVVGVYGDQGGAINENALVGDADTVLSAFERNSYQSVNVELNSPQDFHRFKDFVTKDPRLQVDVKTQKEYVGDQLKQLTTIINFVAYFVGVVMAVGAVFGAINTMYSAVDSRTREIATLRAMGFGGMGVVVSVMVESLALAIPGALLGALVAWLLFNGHAAQISSLSFPLAVTPSLLVLGVVWSVFIGLIGGLAPSIRAARLQVATALRAT
jgi:putative ABC transport system permease protein